MVLDGIRSWLNQNSTWVHFGAMSFLGAVIGHIKEFQALRKMQTAEWHFWNFLVKLTYAIFVSLLVYYAHDYYGWKDQISFVIAGIASVFAKEVVDLVWAAARQRFVKEADINEKP